VVAAILLPVSPGHVAETATWFLVTLGQPSLLPPSETFYFLTHFHLLVKYLYVLPFGIMRTNQVNQLFLYLSSLSFLKDLGSTKIPKKNKETCMKKCNSVDTDSLNDNLRWRTFRYWAVRSLKPLLRGADRFESCLEKIGQFLY
jgi:hypothetical protein